MTHGRDGLMAFEPDVGAPFEVVESQLGFLIFKAAFDPPTRESDVEQLTRRHVRYLVSRDSNDGVTTTAFSVRNTCLSALRLEPAAWFGVA